MKDEYFKTLASRAKQRARLLIDRPDFQKDIALLRKKWSIPDNGLSDEESNRKWRLQLATNTADYYSKTWPKEKKQIIKLRRKGEFEKAEDIRKKISLQAPFNILKNDIWAIVRKYKPSQRWYNSIEHYLLFNDPKNLYKTEGLKVKINWEHGIKQCLIEFDDDTTLPDLRRVWSWARKMKRGKPTEKFHPIPNFDRDKRAYELEQNGKKPKEIENIIQDEFGGVLSYDDINTALKRYKKRLRINQA